MSLYFRKQWLPRPKVDSNWKRRYVILESEGGFGNIGTRWNKPLLSRLNSVRGLGPEYAQEEEYLRDRFAADQAAVDEHAERQREFRGLRRTGMFLSFSLASSFNSCYLFLTLQYVKTRSQVQTD